MQMLNTKYGVTPRIAMNFSMDTSKGWQSSLRFWSRRYYEPKGNYNNSSSSTSCETVPKEKIIQKVQDFVEVFIEGVDG